MAFADLRLRGDPKLVPAVWLETLDGGQDVVVRWPPGFSARFEPQLVIYDARSHPVARAGDILRDASGHPDSNGRLPTLMSFNGVDYPCE